MLTRHLTLRRCYARAATVPPFAPPGFIAPLSCVGVIVPHAAVTICGMVVGGISVRLIAARRLDRHAPQCARRSCCAALPLDCGSLRPRALCNATSAFPNVLSGRHHCQSWMALRRCRPSRHPRKAPPLSCVRFHGLPSTLIGIVAPLLCAGAIVCHRHWSLDCFRGRSVRRCRCHLSWA